MFANSFSISGAIVLFNTNKSGIKYLKYLKGGSKFNKIVYATVTVGVCVGSFLGFSQGSKLGRTFKQKSAALKLFPQLKDKNFWAPLFEDNEELQQKVHQLKLQKYDDLLNGFNTLTWCYPDDEISIARENGLTEICILCKYNNWEIGNGSVNSLSAEIERSKENLKHVVVLEVDSIKQEFKQIYLPKGIVGIHFNLPTSTSDISKIVNMYRKWNFENKVQSENQLIFAM